MGQKPLISVIIPAYNREKKVVLAIHSILNQTFQDFEILVVDDASKDGTQQVIHQLKDKRIFYIRHETNRGGSAARNTGIKNARGEYIAFLDSDDEWLPEKLERQINVFKAGDPQTALVYTGMNILEEGSSEAVKWMPAKRGYFLNELLMKNILGTLSTVIIKKKCLEEVRGLDESLKSCQDWDLYIRLNKVYPFDYIPDYLVNYYINKRDASRISNNRLSIISGHKTMQKKFEADYQALPTPCKIAHFEDFINLYASVGNIKEVLKFTFLSFKLSKDFKYLIMLPRRLARCVKIKIQGKFGY